MAVYQYTLTGDNVAGDGLATVVSIEDRLDAVGVLSSWDKTKNLDLS